MRRRPAKVGRAAIRTPTELAPHDPPQRPGTNCPLTVPQLRQRGRGQRNLCKRRQPLINEPLKPPQRGAFVAFRIGCGKELAKRESVGERNLPHLPRGRLGVQKVASGDRSLESSVCRALACHRRMPLGLRPDDSSRSNGTGHHRRVEHRDPVLRISRHVSALVVVLPEDAVAAAVDRSVEKHAGPTAAGIAEFDPVGQAPSGVLTRYPEPGVQSSEAKTNIRVACQTAHRCTTTGGPLNSPYLSRLSVIARRRSATAMIA
jgi:hypothetical protein